MKLIILLICAASSSARPENKVSVTQDSLGSYNIDVDTMEYTKKEVRHADGTVMGSYSYLAPDGSLQKYEYIADAGGFRILSGTLPVGPAQGTVPENPELIRATNEHLALLAKAGVNGIASVPIADQTVTVADRSATILVPSVPVVDKMVPVVVPTVPVVDGTVPIVIPPVPVVEQTVPVVLSNMDMFQQLPVVASPSIEIARDLTIPILQNSNKFI